MTALAANKGNVSVLTDFYVQDRVNGFDRYCPANVINPRVDYIEVRNPSAVTIIVTIDCPLAFLETARAYSTTTVGTVSGQTASGSGAILDTVSLAAGAKVIYATSSTYNTSPTDLQGDAIAYATQTPIVRLTETTQDGTPVVDPDVLEYPLRPVLIGTPPVVGPNLTGDTFFTFRTPSITQILAGLIARMGDGDTQRVIDAIEMGYNFHDILRAGQGTARLDKVASLATLDANRYSQGARVRYLGGEWYTSGLRWLPYGQNDPSFNTKFFEDFLNTSVLLGLTSTSSGTGAAKATTAAVANHPGIVNLSAGTTTTGVTHIGSDVNSILVGTGPVVVEGLLSLPNLSTSGEEFIVRLGLFDAAAGANPVNGVYLEYNRLTSLKWLMSTAAASTRTNTPATTADIAATTWYRVRVEVNTDRTLCTYYVNDVKLGTVATNIPSAAMGFGVHIIKSAGTTARTVDVDYLMMVSGFATAR